MTSEQERAELQAKHKQLQKEHQDFMADMAQAEIEQAAYKAEMEILEDEIKRLDNAIEEHEDDKKEESSPRYFSKKRKKRPAEKLPVKYQKWIDGFLGRTKEDPHIPRLS